MMQLIPRLGQKVQPIRSIAGSRRNKGKDGRTNQKMLRDKAATASALPVSMYSQMNAKIDVSGKDARTAPQRELRFAASDTATTTATVTSTFTANCHVIVATPNHLRQRRAGTMLAKHAAASRASAARRGQA